jgi:hypothetical protein
MRRGTALHVDHAHLPRLARMVVRLAVRLKPDTTEARACAVLSALFVQDACNNYIPIVVNKEYTARGRL